MTAMCLGSGLVGGLFAPSLFLGATAGAAYQKLVSTVLQYGVASLIPIAGPPAYAMVGAASVLASMFRAPLTGSLLLFELTRCVEWRDYLHAWGSERAGACMHALFGDHSTHTYGHI